jgi:drug/metabolite transporter (DMT)-like permease
MKIPDKFQGILYMFAAIVVFSGMSILVRTASQTIPPVELVFFRNAIGLIFVLPSVFLWWRKQKKEPVHSEEKREKSPSRPYLLPFLLFFRGFVGTVSLYCFFYNLQNAPLGLTMTYAQMAPIFIALFSFFFLKEHLHPVAWFAIMVGFGGVVALYLPAQASGNMWHVWGLIGGITMAMAYTSIRELRRHYPIRLIVLSFLLSGTFFPLASLMVGSIWPSMSHHFFFQAFVMPVQEEWLYIGAIGVSALMGQFLMTNAYGKTKAGVVGAVGYSQIVLTSILGLAFLGDPWFQPLEWLGMGLICLSGLLIAWKAE